MDEEYLEAYERGRQIGEYSSILIWALLGFLITKFIIGNLYKKENGTELPTKIVWIGTLTPALLAALMIFL